MGHVESGTELQIFLNRRATRKDLTHSWRPGCPVPPRRLLRRIPGLRLVELGCSGEISECCGGGGNLESFDPETVPEISLRRVDQACEALAVAGGEGAQALASACQQCERTLAAAARRHEGARRARLRVLDVAELVWQAAEKGGALKGQAQ